METEALKKLQKSSKRSALLSSVGIFIFIGSLIYSSISLKATTEKLKAVERSLNEKELRILSLDTVFQDLSKKIADLKDDEKKLADFLIQLLESTAGSNNQISPEINWDHLTKTILNLPSGKRKTAVFIALLMTWKEIPFELGKSSPTSGFDSPEFLKYVINQVGVTVVKEPNEFLSSAMMRQFERVQDPLPGDLIFYRGQVGNFGLMYLGGADNPEEGLGIGTLQAISPLSIYELKNINTRYFPLQGYYRINYESFE